MNGTTDNKMAVLIWLRANLKLILLGLNALVVVVLLFLLVSEAFFEIRIRGLLKQATTIEEQSKKAEPPKGGVPSPREGERSSRDYPRRMGGGREREGRGLPAEGMRPTSPTQSHVSAAVTSATALTSGAVSANERPSSATQTTTSAIPLVSPIGSTSAMVLINDRAGSATVATSVTTATVPAGVITSPTTVVSRTRPTTPTIILAITALTSGSETAGKAARQVSQWIAQAQKAAQRKLGPMARMGSSPFGRDPRFMGGGPPGMGGPEDPKKRERFAKLEKRSLFGEPRPPVMQPQVEAVLGAAALVGGQWLTVGGKMGEWKVVEIGTDKIVMEDAAGKRQDFMVMPAGGGGEGGGPPMIRTETPGGPGGPGGPMPPPGAGGPTISVSSSSGGMSAIPDEIFARLTGPGGRFEGMSREQLMERLQSDRSERSNRNDGENRERRRRGD